METVNFKLDLISLGCMSLISSLKLKYLLIKFSVFFKHSYFSIAKKSLEMKEILENNQEKKKTKHKLT